MVDRSLIVLPRGDGLLSVRMLDAYNRPTAVARAYGARGCMARTIEEVRAGVREWVANPGPMIIDSRISRAVINLPHRRVLYGKDE